MKLLVDFCSPALDQLALRRLIESGAYDRHICRVRAIYRTRRDRLSSALAQHLPELGVEGVAAGLHVLLQLPADLDDELVAKEALRAGVHVQPLSRSTLRGRSSGLVIGYGRVHETALPSAVAELASAIRRVSLSSSYKPTARARAVRRSSPPGSLRS